MYLAKYSMGEYDDYCEREIFVSSDKEKVGQWVEKFNSLLTKWKNYYSHFEEIKYEDIAWIKEEYIETHFERWYGLKNINEAFIQEIELR